MWELIVGWFLRELVLPGTNARRGQKGKCPLTEDDIRRWCIFLDVSRVDKKPKLKHYFMSPANELFEWLGCPYARTLLQGTSLTGPLEERFWEIHGSIWFDHREAAAKLSQRFIELVQLLPSQWTAVDERLLPGSWLCKHKHIMFLPGKPHGDKGLNVWMLCLNGIRDLVMKFFLLEGDNTDGPTGYGDVLVSLGSQVGDQAVTADSRFTTVKAALELDEDDHPALLHIMPHRISRLAPMLKSKTPNGGDAACLQHRESGLLLVCFHDIHKIKKSGQDKHK